VFLKVLGKLRLKSLFFFVGFTSLQGSFKRLCKIMVRHINGHSLPYELKSILFFFMKKKVAKLHGTEGFIDQGGGVTIAHPPPMIYILA
jgi:hypothetical protein